MFMTCKLKYSTETLLKPETITKGSEELNVIRKSAIENKIKPIPLPRLGVERCVAIKKPDSQVNQQILSKPEASLMLTTQNRINPLDMLARKKPVKLTSTVQSIPPENILQRAGNGHMLVLLQMARLKGFCVECIKTNSSTNYKKELLKICTFCPACPGGNWMCENCFKSKHA